MNLDRQLAELAQTEQADKIRDDVKFWNAVKAIYDGEQQSADLLKWLVEEAGGESDLRECVRHIGYRNDRRAIATEWEEIKGDEQLTAAKIDLAEKKRQLAQVVAEHQVAVNMANGKVAELEEQKSQAANIPTELINTCQDELLKSEREQARQRWSECKAELHDLDKSLTAIERLKERTKQTLADYVPDFGTAPPQQWLDEQESKLLSTRAKRRESEKRVEAAFQRIKEIESKMIDW